MGVPIRTNLQLEVEGKTANAGSANSANATTSPWSDQSGNGRDGTLTNFNGSSSSGWQGSGTLSDPYCLVGDGSNDHVNFGNVLNLSKGSFSVSLWVKTSTTTNYVGMIDKGDSASLNAKGYYFDLNGSTDQGKPRLTIGTGTSGGLATYSYVNGATKVNDGAWHHVAATVDVSTTTGKIYIDNALSATNSSLVASAADSTDSFKLFGDGVSTNYLTGSIAQLHVYDRALTAVEVGYLYRYAVNGSGGAPTPIRGARQAVNRAATR